MNPKRFLQIEGLVFFVIATALYFGAGWGLWWYLAFLLLPDISMFGYLKDSKRGALTYNLGHTYVTPFVFMTITTLLSWQPGYFLGLVWIAHIGLDRLFGLGLKYGDGFKHTHLGQIGTQTKKHRK